MPEVEMTDAMRRYEAERLAQRPDDRALWALGRPVADCKPHKPCDACLEDGVVPTMTLL